jgi:hypothetical protein
MPVALPGRIPRTSIQRLIVLNLVVRLNKQVLHFTLFVGALQRECRAPVNPTCDEWYLRAVRRLDWGELKISKK